MPARVASSARHGISPLDGPVDLERREVVLETPEIAHELRRQARLAHERPVQRGRADVGEHTARRVDRRAVAELDCDRAPVPYHHARDGRRALHQAAARLEATDERGGQLRGTTFGHGEPVLLTQAREHPAEEPARWCVGAHVAVQRVAGEQQRAAFAGERVARELAYRQQRLTREVEEPARSERGREAGGAADWWHRRRHRVEQRVADALELAVQPAPRVTVTRGELLERRRGLVELGRQHRAPTVGGGVRERERSPAPAQPVRLQLQGAHDGRRDAERVERAAEVVDEAGVGELGAAHRAARLGLRLEHEHPPSRVGETVRGDQPVRTGADDDGVDVVHSEERSGMIREWLTRGRPSR